MESGPPRSARAGAMARLMRELEAVRAPSMVDTALGIVTGVGNLAAPILGSFGGWVGALGAAAGMGVAHAYKGARGAAAADAAHRLQSTLMPLIESYSRSELPSTASDEARAAWVQNTAHVCGLLAANASAPLLERTNVVRRAMAERGVDSAGALAMQRICLAHPRLPRPATPAAAPVWPARADASRPLDAFRAYKALAAAASTRAVPDILDGYREAKARYAADASRYVTDARSAARAPVYHGVAMTDDEEEEAARAAAAAAAAARARTTYAPPPSRSAIASLMKTDTADTKEPSPRTHMYARLGLPLPTPRQVSPRRTPRRTPPPPSRHVAPTKPKPRAPAPATAAAPAASKKRRTPTGKGKDKSKGKDKKSKSKSKKDKKGMADI